MNVSISIDFLQLKHIVKQCDLDQKLELLKLLEQETFAVRFKNFLQVVRNDELNLEDITAEVEAVRESRYYAQ
ncbi:MAG: hypothetical protein AUK48_05635 [Oscillatoriales cyanobacterium CG2_30_44_21]|nr:MAG: hypothetical protein AUK48_05635 [Oscillatoriales cyanobacterium CG2_30_44_21]